MYHHHTTRAIAEAHAANLQLTGARNRPTALVRPRHRWRAIIAALVAIGALAPAAGALARPADSGTAKSQSYAEQVSKLPFEELAAAYNSGVPTAEVDDTPGPITFTNPLGRSRGPGAGAGLL